MFLNPLGDKTNKLIYLNHCKSIKKSNFLCQRNGFDALALIKFSLPEKWFRCFSFDQIFFAEEMVSML